MRPGKTGRTFSLSGRHLDFYSSLRGLPYQRPKLRSSFCRDLHSLFLYFSLCWHFVPQTEECRPGRCGRARRFRTRGREVWRRFDATLFGFGAHHRRRQHRAGVLIPSPSRALSSVRLPNHVPSVPKRFTSLTKSSPRRRSVLTEENQGFYSAIHVRRLTGLSKGER